MPLTACLTATIIAQSSSLGLVRVGVAVFTAALAGWIEERRRMGLGKSFAAVNMRHKWSVAITPASAATVRLKVFAFSDRLYHEDDGTSVDLDHFQSFRFPLDARGLTACFWTPLVALAVLSCFVKWLQ